MFKLRLVEVLGLTARVNDIEFSITLKSNEKSEMV